MKIKIINTGGTFSKTYNPITGELVIRKDLITFVKDIISNSLINQNIDFEYYQMIEKDSLDMTKEDRENLFNFINKLECENILVIHGTDTIDKTAEVLSGIKNKKIILTGAMKPFSFNQIEAVANLVQSIISFNFVDKGVYISLNGIIDTFDKVIKDRKKGYFKLKN